MAETEVGGVDGRAIGERKLTILFGVFELEVMA